MTRKKRYTEADVQAAIGRGYRAGIRDGAEGRAFFDGRWLTDEARAIAADAAEKVVADRATIVGRIEAEYQRHVPAVNTDLLRLGDSLRAGTNTLLLTCAAPDCYHGWPCPRWHLLRHLQGWDQSTYTLSIDRTTPTEATS